MKIKVFRSRKRKIEDQFTQLKQTIHELTQQNEEITRRVAIALLVEETKDLSS